MPLLHSVLFREETFLPFYLPAQFYNSFQKVQTFFVLLRPVMVMQYFSLLFKRESGWNPEQCPLL